MLGEYAENEVRKDFTVSERVAIAAEVERRNAGRQGQRTDLDKLRENFPEVEQGERTRDLAARKAGLGSGKTYQAAKQVIDHGAPALVEAMDSGRVSISAAADVAGLDEAEQLAILAEKNPKAFESLPTNFNPADPTRLSLEPGIDAVM